MFVVAGKYHVIAPLGSGGMGAVYEAIHAGTGRRVALKMLRHEIAMNDRARARFVREARAAGSLGSPYVTDVLDAGTDEASGLPYLVMELLEGPNLRDVIAERGPVPVGVVLAVAAHVAGGLAEAHEAGILHRDVKPANIVLCTTKSGEVVAKLVDFGVAKALEDSDDGLTKTGDLIGSVHYMAPEQLQGAPATVASDVWALGLVMHEALTGSAASHDGEPLHRVMQRVCEEGIPPVRQVAPGVPPHVAALVDRALRRDPSERFPSARAMHEALGMLLPSGTRIPAAALAGGAGIVVAPPASALPVVPTLRASYVVGGIASALLVVALALLGRAAVRDPGPASAPTFAKIPEDPPPPAALPVPVAPADDPPREVAPSAPSPARPRGPRTAPPAGARPAAKATDPLDHM